MSRSCPDCGADVEYESRPVILSQGGCAACGHRVTVLVDAPAGTAPIPTADGATPPAAEGPWVGSVPACAECSAPLTFRFADDGIQAVCASCHAESRFVPEGEEEEEDGPGESPAGEAESGSDRPPRRPPRFSPASGGRRFGPPGDRGEPPRARPCRECGGQLQFSVGPDGGVTGECSSCGNRFTLPPRREGFDPDRRGPPRGRFGPRPPGRFGSDRRFDRRGPPGGGRFADRRPPVRRSPPRDRSSDEERDGDADRRRRRPRRE